MNWDALWPWRKVDGQPLWRHPEDDVMCECGCPLGHQCHSPLFGPCIGFRAVVTKETNN